MPTTPRRLLVARVSVRIRRPKNPGTEAEVVEAIKVALELGNDINAVDKNGETSCTAPRISRSLRRCGCWRRRAPKVEIWNQKNRKGWTPLKITQGVHRGMNIQKSPATEAAVRE
jgi:hypothetical protein